MRRKSRAFGRELVFSRLSRIEMLERRLLLTTYYINDTSLANDMWCTAIGSSGNNGLTPATPKAALANITSLAAGDIVRIDTGTYAVPVMGITTAGSGTSTNPITYTASPYGVTFNATGKNYGWSITTPWITVTTALDTTPKYPNVLQQYMKVTGATSAGVYIANSNVTVSQLDVVLNAAKGIQLFGTNTGNVVKNCIVRSTTGAAGWGIDVGSGGTASIINCTVYDNGGDTGRQINLGSTTFTTLQNNIIVCTSSMSSAYGIYRISTTTSIITASDYNDFYVPNGAKVGYTGGARSTLADWQTASGKDANSITANPQFYDAANGNFQVLSNGGRYNFLTMTWVNDLYTSLCIDAGDPTTAYGNEPSPNGGRVNQGAYGNTVVASKQDLIPPSVLSWTLSPDTGYSATDKITTTLKPAMTFNMSELVACDSNIVTLLDPTMAVIDSSTYTVVGWNSLVLTVTIKDNAPLTMPGQYTVRFGTDVHDTSAHTNYLTAPIDLNFTVDLIPPTVAVNQASTQTDPSKASTLHFTALFNEKVYGFTNSGVALGGTAGATTVAVTNPSGDMTTFDLAVTGMTQTGTVTASVIVGAALDLVGNSNVVASSSTDNTVTYDITAPMASFAAVTPNPRGTALDQIVLTFNERSATVTYANLVLSRDGVSIPLNSAVSSISSDVTNWAIINLGAFTTYDGSYTLSTTGLTDLAGNALSNAPSATWFMAGGKIATSAGSNVIKVAVNASDTTQTDVFVNAAGSTPTYTAPTSTFVQFQISCGAGNDQLIIDFTNGNPLPAAGVVFNGGTHTTADTLTIKGNSGNQLVTVTPTMISVTGSPVAYSSVSAFVFDLGTGADELILDGGTLALTQDNALTSGTAVTVNSGTLDLGGMSDTIDSLMLRGGSVTNGTLTAASFYTVSSGTISANLAGAAALFKATTGTVVLSGTNTYTGGTFISGGTLQTAAGASNVLPDSGSIQLYSAGVLDLQGRTENAGDVLVLGGNVINGTLVGATTEVRSGSPTFSIHGSSGLVKTGTGTVTLNLANHYTGDTIVSGGTLVVANADALPSTTQLIIGSAGSVVLDSNLSQAIELSGLSFLTSGAATVASSPDVDAAATTSVSTASVTSLAGTASGILTSVPTNAVASTINLVTPITLVKAPTLNAMKQSAATAFIGPMVHLAETTASTLTLTSGTAVHDAAIVAPIETPASTATAALARLVYAPGKVGPFKKQNLSLTSLDQLFAQYVQSTKK